MTTRFRVNSPNVIHETIEGEVILIDLKTGTYYSLREAGAAIWEAIDRGAGLDAIEDALERRYEGSSDEIREADAGTPGAGPSYYSEDEDFRALHQPASDVVSVLTTEADRGWFWMPDATALPYWDYTAPFRHLLSWWLDAEGFRHVHGGAVGPADGGVLIVGPGR